MSTPTLKLVSSDSHLNEVPGTWARVQRKHGDRAPKIVWNPAANEVGPHLMVQGWDSAMGGANREDCANEYLGLIIGGLDGGAELARSSARADEFRKQFRFEDHPTGGLDPAARLRHMDRDGVQAEILYPSHLRHFYELSAIDEPFFHDIAESYNEWAMEFASYDPKRLIALPVLSVLNPEQAAADIRAYAKRGAKSFMIGSSVPIGKTYGDPEFDPIWQAAVECGVPLGMHTTSGRWKQPEYNYWFATDLIGFQAEAQVSLSEIIYGGVFDRFPDLKIVCAEFDIGWVAYSAQRVSAFDATLGLKLAPIDYLKRNVWFGFQEDRVGCLTTPVFGADNFLWGSDYPHAVTTWPDSRAIIDRQFEGIPETIKNRVVSGNAAALYKLDLS
jgi:predicted TIM-barrel fold metal-dependent hydrolase